jgi:hypothetical protein
LVEPEQTGKHEANVKSDINDKQNGVRSLVVVILMTVYLPVI